MKCEAPALLPIFRSTAQAKILTWLTQHPDAEASVADLAAITGTHPATAQREVSRIDEAALVTSRIHGRNRLVRINTDNPIVAPLTQLLAIAFGPPAVIREEFALDGTVEVVIFGSWAARHAGVPGPQPNDIDVLVIGDTTMLDTFAAADRAQARLGLPVNPQRCTPQRWADPGDDPLIREIRSTHHLTLGVSGAGHENEDR